MSKEPHVPSKEPCRSIYTRWHAKCPHTSPKRALSSAKRALYPIKRVLDSIETALHFVKNTPCLPATPITQTHTHTHTRTHTHTPISTCHTYTSPVSCQNSPVSCQKSPISCQKTPVSCQKSPISCQKRPKFMIAQEWKNRTLAVHKRGESRHFSISKQWIDNYWHYSV